MEQLDKIEVLWHATISAFVWIILINATSSIYLRIGHLPSVYGIKKLEDVNYKELI